MANADTIRSIPCMVDGFNQDQRKVLFTCIKRNDTSEVTVAQLSRSVAEKSAYHHSLQSLNMTIINLAQNFVGRNNINMLIPIGQSGTRLAGGEDNARPRHLCTTLSSLTRLIFHPHDDPLLQYNIKDNLKIEPNWYIPIIPMVLVNGAEGVSTGWSTKIPNHNPRTLIRCLRSMIQGEEPEKLQPWYKNFKGTIEAFGETKFITKGNCTIIENGKIEITELPIGTWTQTYKENVLDPLLHGTDNVKPIITEYEEHYTDQIVRFVISFVSGQFENLEREDGGFHRAFQLSSSLSINSMNALDKHNCVHTYKSSNDILKEFYDIRLEYYGKRKEYLEGMLTAEADCLIEQARFISEKCNNTLVIENKTQREIIDELIRRSYRLDPVAEWKKSVYMEDYKEPELTVVKKYEYLLGMPLWILTVEKKDELLKQRDSKLAELNTLKSKAPEEIWLHDLEVLETKLNEVEKKERDEFKTPSVDADVLMFDNADNGGGDDANSTTSNSSSTVN